MPALNETKPKSNRGGPRPGSGRPRGSKDKATRQAGATLGELARAHTAEALQAILSTLRNTDSDTARIAAANALLDRGYGKPSQSVDHKNSDGSFSPALMTAEVVKILKQRHGD
jgi:hypothetical protein